MHRPRASLTSLPPRFHSSYDETQAWKPGWALNILPLSNRNSFFFPPRVWTGLAVAELSQRDCGTRARPLDRRWSLLDSHADGEDADDSAGHSRSQTPPPESRASVLRHPFSVLRQGWLWVQNKIPGWWSPGRPPSLPKLASCLEPHLTAPLDHLVSDLAECLSPKKFGCCQIKNKLLPQIASRKRGSVTRGDPPILNSAGSVRGERRGRRAVTAPISFFQ